MSFESAAAKGRKQRSILMEDDHLLCQIFAATIRTMQPDIDLLAFENGDDAWRELCRLQPDLLITEALHPGLPGRRPRFG